MSLRGYKPKTKKALWVEANLKLSQPPAPSIEAEKTLFGFPVKVVPQGSLPPDVAAVFVGTDQNGNVSPKHSGVIRFSGGPKKAPWTEAFPPSDHKPALAIKSGAARSRKRVRPMSKHRSEERREYQREAKAFVKAAVAAGQKCPVWEMWDRLPAHIRKWLLPSPGYAQNRSRNISEVHHRRGRRGSLLLDKRYWTAISKWGHRAVHAFPSFFRTVGLLEAWGVQEPL